MRRAKAWAMIALVALWAVLAPGTARAVAGQDAPEFTAAVEAWLQGREETALENLSALAADGNAAAQILLAILDVTPAYQGDFLSGLPRDRRIALMRAPGGLSGQSWMRVAAGDEPLAQAWLRLWDGDAPAEVVLDFARLGEVRASHFAARQLHSREKRGFGAMADDPAFPPSLMPLAILDWQGDDPARARGARGALPGGHPGGRMLALPSPSPEALWLWAESDPLAANLRQTLTGLCPASDDPAQDLAAFLAQTGGFWALAWIGPPSEALVDPLRYAASPLAAQVARRLLRDRSATGGAAPGAGSLPASPCIAALLAEG